METYKVTYMDNGNILLEKIMIDDSKYTVVNMENGNKLLIKNIFITKIAELENYNFSNSTILECIINNEPTKKTKYQQILTAIYNIIDDGANIIRNTRLNIKTVKREDSGFYYLENIGISVQGVDSTKCIKEIITQAVKNNIKITMKIKLITDEIINLLF